MNVDSDETSKSFKDLFDKYYDPLINYIFRRVLNRQNAEDIISNTFFNAYKFLKKNPKIHYFQAWIYKIATNEIIQYQKKEEKHKRAIDTSINELDNLSDVSTENKTEEYGDFVLLHDEISRIKEPGKSVLSLYFFEKKTFPEISKILNINENTLRPMMSRILKKLFERLKNKF